MELNKMKLNKIQQILFLTLSLFAVSCGSNDMRTIYEDDTIPAEDLAEVPIIINDSEIDLSGIDPDLANEFTLILYPIDGSTPTIYIVNSDTPSISIEKGDYAAIIFNGLFDNHPGLLFADINSYTTIKLYQSEADLDSSYYVLYSDSMELISVSDDNESIEFSLTDIFTTMHVTTYISSINLLDQTDNYVIVDGIASGMYLYNREVTLDDPISINMQFTTFSYNVGSTLNGYLRGQFKCFGMYKSEDGTTSNSATLYLKLNGADSYQQFNSNITEDIKIVDNNDQVLSVEIPNITIVN